MKWQLNRRSWRLHRRRQKGSNAAPTLEAALLRRARAEFSTRWQEVLAACEALSPVAEEAPLPLARQYMTRVLEEEREAAWWRENAPYLAQPWFIWQYGQAKGLLSAPAPATPLPLLLIRPKGGRRNAWAHLRLSREATDPDRGWLEISGPREERAFQALMRRQGLWLRDGNYVRRVGETASPLMDRAAETGVLLLEAGYSLSVEEPLLRDRILRRQFAPERRHWVLTSPQRDKLRLAYPRDQRLHQYVCKAGAVWNGRYMEISIRYADRVEELMRLYGFQATAAARRRLEIWNKALEQAVVYRAGKRKTEPPGDATTDLFKKLLDQKIDVIEDLRETDE